MMKYRPIFVGMMLPLLFISIGRARQNDFPVLKGPYLGQTPPGSTPELFAPGVISGIEEHQNCLTFSPDGKEIYWGRYYKEKKINKILVTKFENGRWTPPQFASFSGGTNDNDDAPFISPDGQKLLFNSRRPINENDTANTERIWVVEKIGSSWTEPKPLSKSLINLRFHMQFSISENGSLYFHSRNNGTAGSSDIFCSRYVGNEYSTPEKLGGNINTEYFEMTPFIAPDESYLLFVRNRIPYGYGLADLYVSFRTNDGGWTGAVNLGEAVNTRFNEACPIISPDGKYLFFNSDRNGNSDIYWVDAKIIEALRPEVRVSSRSRSKDEATAQASLGEPARLFILGGFKERDIYPQAYSIPVADLQGGRDAVWTAEPSLPKALQGHTAVTVGRRLIVVGGLEGFDENRRAIYSPEVFSADVNGSRLGEWKRQKPLPHPLAYHAAVRWKDFIIVSGGQTPRTVSTVLKASVAASGEIGGWEVAGALPKPMRGHASVMVGDCLFILGGHDDRGFFAEVYSAALGEDGGVGKWKHATPLPMPLVHSGAAEHDGRIYVFGGQDAQDNLRAEVYSAKVIGSQLANWRKEKSLPVPQSRMGVNAIDERIIVSGGGFGWAPPVYSEIFVSDIGKDGELKNWLKIGDLPRPCAFHAAVLLPEKKRP